MKVPTKIEAKGCVCVCASSEAQKVSTEGTYTSAISGFPAQTAALPHWFPVSPDGASYCRPVRPQQTSPLRQQHTHTQASSKPMTGSRVTGSGCGTRRVLARPVMVSARRVLQDLQICQQFHRYTKNSFSYILKSLTCYWNSNDPLWVFLNLATWIWIVWKPQSDSSFVCMRRADELPKSLQRFPTRNYWAKRSHCSVMRNIYTQTRWTFNVIWFPSRLGLVTEGSGVARLAKGASVTLDTLYWPQHGGQDGGSSSAAVQRRFWIHTSTHRFPAPPHTRLKSLKFRQRLWL